MNRRSFLGAVAAAPLIVKDAPVRLDSVMVFRRLRWGTPIVKASVSDNTIRVDVVLPAQAEFIKIDFVRT